MPYDDLLVEWPESAGSPFDDLLLADEEDEEGEKEDLSPFDDLLIVDPPAAKPVQPSTHSTLSVGEVASAAGEAIAKTGADIGRSLAKGSLGVAGAAADAASMSPVPWQSAAAGLASGAIRRTREALTIPEDEEPVLSSPRAFAKSLLENLPTLAAGAAATLAGGPVAGGATMFTIEAGNHYGTLRESGVPEDRARAAAAVVGGINAAIEQIPLGRLARMFGGRLGAEGTKQALKQIASQAAIETGTENVQEIVSWASEMLNAEDPEAYRRANPLGKRLAEVTAVSAPLGALSAGAAVSGGRPAAGDVPAGEEGPATPAAAASDVDDVEVAAPAETGVPLRSPESPTPQREAGFVRTPPQPERLYEMARPEIEQEIQRSKMTEPPSVRDMTEQLGEALARVAKSFSIEYPELSHGSKHAALREHMRMYREGPEIAAKEISRRFGNVLRNLDPAEHDLYVKKRAMDNARAIRENDPGVPLPHGLTDEDLATDGPRIDFAVQEAPKVAAAIEADRALWSEVRNDFAKALDEMGQDTDWLYRRGDAYMHLRAAEYARDRERAGKSGKLPKGWSFAKKYEGAAESYSLDPLVQAEVLTVMMADAMRARSMLAIRDDKQAGDISKRVRATRDQENRATLKRLLAERGEHIPDNVDSMGDRALRSALGDQYRAWRDFIPEGYGEFYPGDRRNFATGLQVSDRAVMDMMEGIVGEVAEAHAGPSVRMRKAVMTYPGKTWVLPDEVVSVLERQQKDTSRALDFSRGVQAKWKQAVLFLPQKVVKYLARNAISDWTGALQFRPSLAMNPQKIRRAAGALSDYIHRGADPKGPLAAWILKGGGNAGLFEQELRAGERLRSRRFLSEFEFESFLEAVSRIPKDVLVNGSVSQIRKATGKYWNVIRKNTGLLESTLRYAMFRDVLEELETNGGRPLSYMASLKEEIDALPDNVSKAYWLSNDAMGAYDMTSEAGQALARGDWGIPVPFVRFAESTLRAQWRGLKNALTDDRVGKAFAAKYLGQSFVAKAPGAALAAGKFIALGMALELLLKAVNSQFPEAERDLPQDVRDREHFLLGRGPNGEVYYFNRFSKFREALEWMGLGEFSEATIRDYLDGRLSLTDAARQAGLSIIDKAYNSVGPIGLKGILEVATGIDTFPSVTRFRPAEDRVRKLFQMWGLEREYDLALDRPTKQGGDGRFERYVRRWPEFVTYSAIPGESQWYDAMALRREYREKVMGKEDTRVWASDRGIALRRMKRALRSGETDLATKYLAEYASHPGASLRGMVQSIRMMHPLYGISDEDRLAYQGWLRPEEKEAVNEAIEYWEEVLAAGLRDLLAQSADDSPSASGQ